MAHPAFVGFAMLVGNVRFLARSKPAAGKFAMWGVKVAGTVGAPTSDSGKNTYYPVVTFHDAEGREHRVTGKVGTQSRSRPSERKGASFPVRYVPADPAGARIVTFSQFWLFPIAFLAIGLFVAAVAAGG